MSFQSRDLMIGLSPVARPGFEMCGEATRDSQEGGGDADRECGEVTRDNEPAEVSGMNMAVLRQHLRDTLALEAR